MWTKILNIATHPELAKYSLGKVHLSYTAHAQARSVEKNINIQAIELISAGSIVEIETLGTAVTKIVARLAHDSEYDKVLVLVPVNKVSYRVITCWLNHKLDMHKTLNKERLSA